MKQVREPTNWAMADLGKQHGADTSHVAGPQKDRELRRTVQLRGVGVIPDQSTFHVDVLDLSYDGCRIRTQLSLVPGARFQLSILGIKGALNAMVRWSRDDQAGLQFNPEECLERTFKDRKEERVTLDARVSLRLAGRQGYYGRALDLTPKGCKVEFVERPKEGEVLWAKFDGLDAIEATVRWVDGYFGGLEFATPIYPAVFDLLLARLRS